MTPETLPETLLEIEAILKSEADYKKAETVADYTASVAEMLAQEYSELI